MVRHVMSRFVMLVVVITGYFWLGQVIHVTSV